MSDVFADTGYWVALEDPRDRLHEKALALTRALGPRRIVTTQMVLVEMLNIFGSRGERQGGSVADLDACAETRDVTALYVLHGGAWVSYILGAPEFVNEDFAAVFPDGLPALTPLVARSPVPTANASQAGAADR